MFKVECIVLCMCVCLIVGSVQTGLKFFPSLPSFNICLIKYEDVETESLTLNYTLHAMNPCMYCVE